MVMSVGKHEVTETQLRTLAEAMRRCGVQRFCLDVLEVELTAPVHADGPIPVDVPETEIEKVERLKAEADREEEILYRSVG